MKLPFDNYIIKLYFRQVFNLTSNVNYSYYMNMKIVDYDRESAVSYAKTWAYKRNPDFYNFDKIGGDCTNFASQCILAGGAVMNFTAVTGWFYRSANDRTASWTGVEYLYNFLIGNNGVGPFAKEISIENLEIGDIVQLGRETGDFYHTPIVVGFKNKIPLVAAHSYDTYGKPLYSYSFEKLRCLHILGVRIF